jgi:hypothetical protein
MNRNAAELSLDAQARQKPLQPLDRIEDLELVVALLELVGKRGRSVGL